MIQKNKVFIIAEAGVNHNGSLELAKKLVDVAVEANADSVKFQTFVAENVISSQAKMADYQLANTGKVESQLEMVKKLELKFNDFIELKKYCETKGILFLSTPFDLQSIAFLKTLNLPIMKIPSGEITNLPYLRKVGEMSTNVIVSTGMSTMEEIEAMIKILVSSGTSKDKITLLHCNTEYPTPMKDVNLCAISTLKSAFGVNVGYSDHTLGIEIPIAAVAMGATVIEKHFTLDKTMEGPDHRASLDPNELKAMVASIRNIEIALGNGKKTPSESEMKNMVIARKSIHLKTGLLKGHILQEIDLIMKRPGDGISPMLIEKILDCKLNSDFPEDHMLKWDDLDLQNND